MDKRLLAQFIFFLLQNPFLKNFFTGRIYQGRLKHVCTPGLNCYSCPAAAMSCPIGAAQHNINLYVSGFLITVGLVFGRFICGFVCPMGWVQDLLYRIKSPKLILRLRYLRYVKYVVLILFVIILPMIFGNPWFCAYICPSGTLFAAIPLIAANDFLRELIGMQFILKLAIAIAVVVLSVFILRIFCRVLCPLGAIYGLFNRIAFMRMGCDTDKCVACGSCSLACHIKIDPVLEPNSPECFRCGDCVKACKQKAKSLRI